MMPRQPVTITIRQANNSDLETLTKLARETYSAAFGHSLSAADLASHLENKLSLNHVKRILDEDTVLIAETEDRMIGFVQFGHANLVAEAITRNYQEIRRLYVQAEFQNKGIGAQLMEAALAHPNSRHAERILLDVWEHNHGAQRFYERYGFKVEGERKFEVASGAETSLDLIMVRHRSG